MRKRNSKSKQLKIKSSKSHPLTSNEMAVPFSAKKKWREGAKLYQHGDVNSAISAFKTAVDLYPTYIAAINDLGVCYLDVENYHAAQQAFWKVLECEPENLHALENLGLLCISMGNYQQAVDYLENVLKEKPQDAATRRNLEVARHELSRSQPLSLESLTIDRLSTAPKISLCLITKNEEDNLPRLFESLKDAVDEIILVDTGSSDNTVNIAADWEAKIFQFEWINDFAAAKNAALDQATGDWILHVDADMELEAGHARLIRKAVASKQARAYMINVRSSREDGQSETVAHSWLFENHPGVRFKGAVHEQIWMQLTEHELHPRKTSILIHHFGYMDPEERNSRYHRDIQILQDQIAAGEGNDPFTAIIHFYLGRAYVGLKEFSLARDETQRFLQFPRIHWRIRANALHILAECYLGLGDHEAARDTVTSFTNLFPHDRAGWVKAGKVYALSEHYTQAITSLKIALETKPSVGTEGLVLDIEDHNLYFQLGEIYSVTNQHEFAHDSYQRALDSGHPSGDVFFALGKLEMGSGNYSQAESCFKSAIRLCASKAEPYRQLGLLYFEQGKLDPAVEAIKSSISIDPHRPGVHNDLGAAYASSGDFFKAAENFGMEMEINPQNDRTLNNMGSLQLKLGDVREAVACFSQALRINPQNIEVRKNLLSLKESLS